MQDLFQLAQSGAVTPASLGYYFPAEFAPQEAMWLSWPHKEESWPGKIETIYAPYSQFVADVAQEPRVHINVADEARTSQAIQYLQRADPLRALERQESKGSFRQVARKCQYTHR